MKTNLEQEEEVVLVTRKHWLVVLGPIVWTLGLLIAYRFLESEYFLFCAGVTLVWLIYRIIDRNTNLWVVTNLRIINEYGVFSNNSKETPLDKINNVSYKQSLLGRAFGYGSVQIQSAADFGSTNSKIIENPKLLKDVITQQQMAYSRENAPPQTLESVKYTAPFEKKSSSDISSELTKLYDLKERGIITEEEFKKGKTKIFE